MTGGRLIALAALCCTLVPPAGADQERAPRGFDHLEHARRLEARGVKVPECASCHPGGARGRPDPPGHGACFGACHGDPPPARSARARRRAEPYPVEEERLSLCRICHPPASLASLSAGTREPARPLFPPYALAPDFGIRTAHPAHEGETRCSRCHEVPADPDAAARPSGRPAHDRCVGCHAKSAPAEPAMSQCTGCHRPRAELAPAARRAPAGRFTHKDHQRRLGAGGECTACHAWDRLAATKATCRGCHDGDAAFSMTAPTCRRCHTAPPPRRRGERPTQRFSHRRHQERGLKARCDECHQLGESGAPMPASADHGPCADAGCHRQDFAAREPTTCGACHIGFEPWLDLHADRAPRSATEFGARFSHEAHLGGDSPRLEAACERCHQEGSARRLTPPRGHRSCAGESCHQREGGAKPRLTECGGCHVQGLMAGHVLSRIEKRWTVRAKFDHRPHRFEPGKAKEALPCLACHEGVLEATRLDEVPVPPKEACARCHDGRAAFKLTGHGCARCHGG